MSFSVSVGGRGSLLSRKQVEEVLHGLQQFHPGVVFEPVWIATLGDLDRQTSLRTLGRTDFFTKEIDERQCSGEFRISIHSAKDLPDPLAPGLRIVALTKGVDPSDVLVLAKALSDLPERPRIGTSCARRDQAVLSLVPDARIVDIRGVIQERLDLIAQKKVEGVVMARAALIRLGITGYRQIPLEGETAPLQGRLAVIARQDDKEMKDLFSCLDIR